MSIALAYVVNYSHSNVIGCFMFDWDPVLFHFLISRVVLSKRARTTFIKHIHISLNTAGKAQCMGWPIYRIKIDQRCHCLLVIGCASTPGRLQNQTRRAFCWFSRNVAWVHLHGIISEAFGNMSMTPLSILSAPSVYSNISVCAHVLLIPLPNVFLMLRPDLASFLADFMWFKLFKILLRCLCTLANGLLMLTRSCHLASVRINSRALWL